MTEKLKDIQEVLNSLILNVKAKKGNFNAFGKYKYRTGEDILEAVKDELRDQKYPNNVILISNAFLEEVAGRLFVKVVTKLALGDQSIEAVGYAEHGKDKKGMDDAQLTGATSTYAKKYSLQNLFQLDESEEDIDAKDNTIKSITTEQGLELENLAKDCGVELSKVCAAYKINSIIDLDAAKFETVKKQILSKKKNESNN